MTEAKSNKKSENIIYLIFWILVLIFPVLLSPGREGIDWVRVTNELLRIFPFLLIFLINNFALFNLLKNKKYLHYFLVMISVVLAISILSSFSYVITEHFNISSSANPDSKRDTLWILNTIFYNIVGSILVIGLNDAIKMTVSWLQDRKDYEQLQKENVKNQLSLLQHQINPHFFMNTLNNIHALIEFDPEIAKKSVVKLSQLMRVLLYENDRYTLQKEIDFINDYIELMRIRVNQNVEIVFDYPEKIPEVNLPPLLFISLVENSFKHGILAVEKSFIHISFKIIDNLLEVEIRNSKAHKANTPSQSTPIGLNNSKKRLDLIYHTNYTFVVHESNNEYMVRIKVPLYEN